MNADREPRKEIFADASQTYHLPGTLRPFITAFAILMAAIALGSAYLVGAGYGSFSWLFWATTSMLFVVLAVLVILESYFDWGCAREQLIVLLLVTISLTSINPLTTSYGLPGYDQSAHLGSIRMIQEYGWPFPKSLALSPGTSYVGSYPALDFLTLETKETSSLSLFIVGRIVPWALSLTFFGLFAGIIYKSSSRRAYLVPYMLLLGGNYVAFYFHTWLVSESFSFCMLAAILLLVLRERPLRLTSSAIMLLVFVVSLNLSHEQTALWFVLLLVFLVLVKIMRRAFQHTHPEGYSHGERYSARLVSVYWLVIAMMIFASVMVFEELYGVITQSWHLLTFLLGQRAGYSTVSLSASTPALLLLWIGMNLVVILFIVTHGVLGFVRHGKDSAFVGWFLPGLLVSGLVMTVALISMGSGETAVDISRVFSFIQVTLIALLVRPHYRVYLKFVAFGLAVVFVSIGLVRLPPYALDHDFHPTASRPAQTYFFQNSDYVGAEWLSRFAENIYSDEPLSQLIQGIWQSRSFSNQSLYSGGFDFGANRGTYAFRGADFDMVQLRALHEGTFIQLSKGLFQSYGENPTLALTYDNGNVVAFTFASSA